MDTHPAAPASPVCPRCSAPLPDDAPEGLCPRCVAAGNFLTGSFLAAPPSAIKAPAKIPAPSEIAADFPQLEIESVLGRGGMGVVYLARQKGLDRRVALKLLAPERTDDPVFAARFSTEAQALARLHHPHIVTVHDFGRAGGYYYLLMEYVDGLSLRQLQRTARLAPAEALAIVPQICDALQYAHEQGVVHRDIKPENILVDRQGRVKVADFGLARLGSARDAEEADVAMGTPGYMAPEQRTHPDRVDHRADIYALGAVFYEMLTGSRPEAPFATPSRQVKIDVRLDEVVLRALEKEPERRWQQAGELKTQVETILTTPSSAKSGAKMKGPSRGVVVLALALIVFGGAAAWRWWSRSTQVRAEQAEGGEMVNLSAHYTPRKLGAKDLSRALETIEGAANFDGLRFQVDGQITLSGDEFKDRNPQESYPAAVKEIALGGRRFDELHLLNVTYWENPQGEPVATLRLRYEDGGVAEFPLRYGVEVRDWSRRNSEEHERLTDPDNKIVKRDLKRNQHQATTRITKTRLMNPRPGEAVRSMELEAAPGLASYSLLAATTARKDPRREVTPAVAFDRQEEDFEREMLVKVLDRATGAPLSGKLISVGGDFSGANVMAEPVRTDAKGEARVRYPWRDSLRTWKINLWLRGEGGATDAWMSWSTNYPRTAYFFVGDPGQHTNNLERLSGELPGWRRPIARALLAEFGHNAIAPTLPDPSGRITSHDERAWDDLGSLVQGTRGAVLFKAATVQEGGPEGTDYQNLEQRDAGGYEALHGAKDAAKKAFLDWAWGQAAPNAAPLAEWKVEPPEHPGEFRSLTEAELAAALDAVKAALGGKSYMEEFAPPIDPSDAARRAATDALLERLRGTALDYWLETSAQMKIGKERSFGPSVRVYDLLQSRIDELAERGAVMEIRIRNQERLSIRSFVVGNLFEAQEKGELTNLLKMAPNGGWAAHRSETVSTEERAK